MLFMHGLKKMKMKRIVLLLLTCLLLTNSGFSDTVYLSVRDDGIKVNGNLLLVTKELYKNKYDAYYKVQAHCMTQEQIIGHLLNPEDIYPKIKCPVLGVFGTEDVYLDYATENSAMQSLLRKGGNNQYTSLVFEGYDHQISKQVKHNHTGKYFIEDFVIEKIMKWISSI